MVRHGTVWVHAPLGFDLYGPGDSIFVALADTGGIHPFLVQHRSWLSRVPLRGSPDHARCRGNWDKIDAEMVERLYVCLLAGSFSDVFPPPCQKSSAVFATFAFIQANDG